MDIVRDDSVVKDCLRATVLGTDLKNPNNLNWIKRLKNSVSYKFEKDGDIVGYIIVSKGGDKYDYLEYIGSFKRGQHFGSQMIDCYSKKYMKELIPYEILEESVGYWIKYYQRRGFCNIGSLFTYLVDNDVPPTLKWTSFFLKYDNQLSAFLNNSAFVDFLDKLI